MNSFLMRSIVFCLDPFYRHPSHHLRTLARLLLLALGERDIARFCDGLEVFFRRRKRGPLTGIGLPPLYDRVAISRVELEQPRLAAAIWVGPEPPKISKTVSPRREQSRMASATSATGFTVGRMVNSSRRLALMLPMPA